MASKPPAIIFDCDGVLFDATMFKANPDWKEKGDETLSHGEFKDKWDEFYSHISEFHPIKPIIDTAIGLSIRYPILVLTGRPEAFRLSTRVSLGFYNIKCTELFMRKNDDRRPAFKIKREILEQKVLSKWTPILAFENDEKTIEMYQEHGILTYCPAHKLV